MNGGGPHHITAVASEASTSLATSCFVGFWLHSHCSCASCFGESGSRRGLQWHHHQLEEKKHGYCGFCMAKALTRTLWGSSSDIVCTLLLPILLCTGFSNIEGRCCSNPLLPSTLTMCLEIYSDSIWEDKNVWARDQVMWSGLSSESTVGAMSPCTSFTSPCCT